MLLALEGGGSSWLCGWIARDARSKAAMAVYRMAEDQGGMEMLLWGLDIWC